MKKKNIGFIIMLLVGAVVGFFAGFGGMGFIRAYLPEPAGPFEWIMQVVVLLVILISSVTVHVILHEAGHFITGKISGYSFVSFRVFNIIFIKENGKLVRKKFNIVGTMGQCLMSPPELVDKTLPFVLYNLGGSLMNFLLCAVCIGLYLIFPFVSLVGLAALYVFVIIGVLLGLTNIIPLKMSGIANDGYNAMTLGKNEVSRRVFWLQLRINALITMGSRLRDLPIEWFESFENYDMNDPIIAAIEYYRYCYLLDKKEFDSAKALAENLLANTDKMLEVHKNELRCELLFHEIIGECRKEEIDRLYTKQLKSYIKATSSYISRQRLLYAYARLVLKNDGEALKAIEAFKKTCSHSPFKGEIAGEQELIELIDSKLINGAVAKPKNLQQPYIFQVIHIFARKDILINKKEQPKNSCVQKRFKIVDNLCRFQFV